MTTLYVDRRDATLDIVDGAVEIRVAGACIAKAPLIPLERVVLRGHMMLSTSLIGALNSNRTGLLVLSGRRGEPMGSLLGQPPGDAAIRIGQTLLHLDPHRRLSLARRIVRSKLVGSRRALAQLEPPAGADRRAWLAARDGLPTHLERAALAADVAELTGVEGAAAALYFPALGAAFPGSLKFSVRSRRPPRDPTNALLSLGYTLAVFEAACSAVSTGLDPMIGFLHAIAPNRPSLACDLVEPLRPNIDLWALALFRTNGLRADHFTRHNGACLLGKAGRAVVYRSWEADCAPHLRRVLRGWCRMLATKCRSAATSTHPNIHVAPMEQDDDRADALP